jgi:hypothetical protein
MVEGCVGVASVGSGSRWRRLKKGALRLKSAVGNVCERLTAVGKHY